MRTARARRRNHPSPPATNGGARAAILLAAERIFADAGLAGARIDAIAEAAGVNKALLYYYFDGKDDLYFAALQEQFCEFNRQALEILTAAGPAQEILLRYLSFHFDTISRCRRLAPLHQQLLMAGGKAAASLVRKYAIPRSRALGRLLERGMRDGEFRRADVRHTAVSIIALIVFYFSVSPMVRLLGHADAYSAADLARRKAQVLDFVRHGVFAKPGKENA
jgi:TetR/AcrR family transcriptional regulator